MAIELSWEDVSKVAAKIEESGKPVTRGLLAEAFGVTPSTISNIARREGWEAELKEATSHRIRSVDEALKAVADLVA